MEDTLSTFHTNIDEILQFESHHMSQQSADEEVTLQKIFSYQKMILSKVPLLLSNQVKIMQQMAKVEKKIDSFSKLAERLVAVPTLPTSTQFTPNTNAVLTATSSSHSEQLTPINSLEHMQELEAKLNNETYMAQMIEKTKYICGESGRMDGLNCCYSLVDRIFTRKFLTQCSWAGGARNAEGTKIPFKMYVNLLKLFSSLIRLADTSFSEMECQRFFQVVIRNSKSRYLSQNNKGSRISKKRRRPSNLKYRKILNGDRITMDDESVFIKNESYDDDDEQTMNTDYQSEEFGNDSNDDVEENEIKITSAHNKILRSFNAQASHF